MSNAGPRRKKKSKKSSRAPAWLMPVIVIVVLVGLGVGGWMVVPRLFPGGLPGVSSLRSRHESLIKTRTAATLARLEIRRGMTDAATAKAALPAYQKAVERETELNWEWHKLLTESPPDPADRRALHDLAVQETKKVRDLNREMDQARIGQHYSVEEAILAELRPLMDQMTQLNKSIIACSLASSVLNQFTSEPVVGKADSSPAATTSSTSGAATPASPTTTTSAPASTPTAPSSANASGTPSPNSTPAAAVSAELPELSALPNEPPTTWPPLFAPPVSEFQRKHGPLTVHVRLTGLARDTPIHAVLFRVVIANPGGGQGAEHKTATGHFVEVGPVPDLMSFASKIGSLGKVLQIDEEKRIVVLWLSPDAQRDLQKTTPFGPGPGFPGFSPLGPQGRTGP